MMDAKSEEFQRLPKHVAVIMDGNGRWAKARGLPRTAGHSEGSEAARNLVSACTKRGIPYLTLYAFSAENWQRPEQEICELMRLLRHYLSREVDTLHKNNVRLKVIGDRSQLELSVQEAIAKAEEYTANNQALELTLALSYGSRQEIISAVQSILDRSKAEKDRLIVDEETIKQHLYTANTPDPDLLIRTGGEQRISNFLLWQIAYAELWFTDTLWPDFSEEDFDEALKAFAKRERRYGLAPKN
jgi:undecaprenyl diphosphate synthase